MLRKGLECMVSKFSNSDACPRPTTGRHLMLQVKTATPYATEQVGAAPRSAAQNSQSQMGEC
jgi:hypothetical protein